MLFRPLLPHSSFSPHFLLLLLLHVLLLLCRRSPFRHFDLISSDYRQGLREWPCFLALQAQDVAHFFHAVPVPAQMMKNNQTIAPDTERAGT